MNRFIYPYDLNINLTDIQNKLANQVIREDMAGSLERIAGVDISFAENNLAVAVAVSFDLENIELVEQATRKVELHFPYIPGFLGFREADAMVSVLNDLNKGFDAAMVNGHGVLHPRGFGLASQIGLLLDKPTLGLAKRLISGNYLKCNAKLNGEKTIELVMNGKDIEGAYLNGYYVSIGHKISLSQAINIVKKTSNYRTPEPLRAAHIQATKTFKDLLKIKKGFI
ncbi:MAG TPA: endonuclease V [Methanobacterium sp.]|nr:endonuclease V [Methanobacterium sp.]